MKKISILTAFLIILPFLLNSCKEDPIGVKPLIQEDTIDVYDWTIDTIYGYNCTNPYAADSENVFIAAYPRPLYYNGQTYAPMDLNDPLFNCIGVTGYNKDNVFWGGGKRGTYWGDPVLKKWTNGNVTSYTLAGDSGVIIAGMFIEGPDQCWLSTGERYKVYYFNAGVITAYTLDSGCRMSGFYRDISGTLFAFPIKVLGLYDAEYSYYKLSNNTFQILGKDTVTQTSEMNMGIIPCGIDLLRGGRNSIFYFNGTDWQKLCNTNFNPKLIAGSSKNNLVCYGQSETGPWEIYSWNGFNWKRERSKNIYHGLADPGISITNTTVEIILFIDAGLNYHLRGKLKTK